MGGFLHAIVPVCLSGVLMLCVFSPVEAVIVLRMCVCVQVCAVCVCVCVCVCAHTGSVSSSLLLFASDCSRLYIRRNAD